LEEETVGYVQLKKAVSRVATSNPDRSHTRIVFIDAVEPKKNLDAPATHAHPFPNTIDLTYDLVPHFIPNVDNPEFQTLRKTFSQTELFCNEHPNRCITAFGYKVDHRCCHLKC